MYNKLYSICIILSYIHVDCFFLHCNANELFIFLGCDTGFGNLLARKLDSNGYKVFAGCLFPDGAHAKQLVSDCSNKLETIKLDVTSDDDVDDAVVEVAKKLVDSKCGKSSLVKCN